MFQSSQNNENATAVVDNPSRNGGRKVQGQRKNAGPQRSSQKHQQSIVEKIRNFRLEFGPGSKDILNFTNQLAVMVKAGISLQDALEAISEQQPNKKFAAIIVDIKKGIESGESFSQALAEHSEIFSSIYINMVAAAEVSGSLSEMLQKLAGYLGQEAETRSQIKGAMVYPMIIAVMAITVTIFLLCFVVPRFYGIFAGKEHLLPMPTKMLMASSVFLRHYWFLLVPAIAAAIWAFIYFINTPPGRFWWDKTKLSLPIIKTLCRSLYITRSLHTMGVLSHAGVPILDTLSITAHISGNILYKNMWLGVFDEVRQGKKIASGLQQYNLMPPDVIQMIRSGEDSGTMSEVLKDVSEYYGRVLKNVIKTVTSMIEPIMIVLMGCLVGFIAMSIMLPIFKMSNLVTGK